MAPVMTSGYWPLKLALTRDSFCGGLKAAGVCSGRAGGGALGGGVFTPRPRRAAPPTFSAGAERGVRLRVRESARARRIVLRIDAGADAVELVLPKRVPLAAGLRFLEARRD